MPFCRRRFSAACRSRRTRKNLTAEIPENPSWGYIFPMCGWEIDYDVEGEPDKPSDQNHGLSLTEARWNFHSFGTVAPWKVMEN